jgi:hypothetical protein
MVRRTSINAYRKIQADGTLSQMRWAVYDYLFHHGPLTGSEITEGLRFNGQVSHSFHKRLSELEVMGVAEIVGERVCKVTGFNCILWDVTDLATPIPYKTAKTKTKLARARERCSRFEELVARIVVYLDREKKLYPVTARIRELVAEIDKETPRG